ncbi:putative RING-H2 finger protein ATL69 isoform X2 [Punica granatum]|nr:putative RING-H2 finger protein ATL69 isoform X2 [Punica granatum]
MVTIPVPWHTWSEVTEYISLKWDRTPLCEYCQKHGGSCKYEGDSTIKCPAKRGISKRAKIGIILGVASPCFLGILGISCYLSSRNRRQPNGNVSPEQHARPMGMDGPAIELYPKTEVGDSGQLPCPSDNTCSICLSEYQPKDTLRTIPNCSHYFHARCIDPWLKRNGSCPLCRNRQGSPAKSITDHTNGSSA